MNRAEDHLLYNVLRQLTQTQPVHLARHVNEVAYLSAAVATLYGCTDEEQQAIYVGGLLHDIGKQFIPTRVLNKPGLMNRTEYSQIQSHAWKGFVYLNRFTSNSTILNTVLYHHERWNGSGYPYALRRDEIPLCARICAVTDVWDAITSDRCYRGAWDMDQALDLIWTGAGSLFDPEIAMLFLGLIENGSELLDVSNREVMDLPARRTQL